ncbi:hypothetical protein [Hyphomicrobium sp.]|uniref:hypothetical protein n=1 Tax=Hyphomicrobium sp. TaxID=82 RepID=UPI003F6F522D
MTLGKQTKSQTQGFGRRSVTAPAKASAKASERPAPQRQPTVSARPEQRTHDALGQTAKSVGEQVSTSASRGKAYLKACLAGTTAFIAVLFMLTGVDNRVFEAGPMLIVLAVPVLPTLALILYIPTVVLSDVARLLSVPRGWADLAIGFLLGAGLGVGIATTSPDEKSMIMAIATTAGGLMGGFAFWRAQGYPGTSSGTAAALDLTYEKLT